MDRNAGRKRVAKDPARRRFWRTPQRRRLLGVAGMTRVTMKVPDPAEFTPVATDAAPAYGPS